MKWLRPSGSEIETSENDATIEYCESLGWKRMESEPEEQPTPEGEVMLLYKRLKGEWVEGEEPNDEVILESHSFPVDAVRQALKDGWFMTQDEASYAPPDKPEGNKKGNKK